jgi:hypothetical protein
MSMSVGGVSPALSTGTSAQAGGSNEVQLQAAIGVQKKAQDLQADQVRTLIASATGVGRSLDVQG